MVQFVKMHGLGNDFILIDPEREGVAEDELPEVAVRYCDRHFGIGADGLLCAYPSNIADLKMRIFNPDGSEAQMCGNGIRCFGKYVFERRHLEKNPLRIETAAGVQELKLDVRNGEVHAVEVDMGEPILRRSLIPMAGLDTAQVVNEPLRVDGATYTMTCVSMGNPHCVIFVEDVASIPLEAMGPKIEHHPLFPERINVHFAEVISRSEVRVRVWERGAGMTFACGTGACAVLVAGVLTNRTERKCAVDLPGGGLVIEWKENNHVAMTGPATEVFTGVTVD